MILLDFNGLYGQDSYEYTRYTQNWINFIAGGAHPGDYHWPMNYPVTGGLLGTLGLSASFALQLISLLSFIGNGILLYHCLRVLHPRFEKIRLPWIFLGFLLSPFILRTGLVAMSDQFASFLILAAFYFAISTVKEERDYHIVGFFFMASMAVMTRYISILIVLPMFFYTIGHIWKRKLFLHTILGLAASIIPLIPHWYIRSESVGGFVEHGALSKWSIANMFSRVFETDLGYFEFTVPNILYVFNPFVHAGFLFFGVFLLFFYKRITLNKEIWLIISIITLYLLFFAGVDTQNDRYFVTLFPIITLFLFPMFIGAHRWLNQKLKKPWIFRFWVVLGVIQLALCTYTFKKFYVPNQQDKAIASMFEEHKNITVYTYGKEMAMSYYNQKNTFITLHEKDGLKPEAGTYFLFDHTWLKNEQVKELFPVILYQKLQKNDRLKSVQKAYSWELFEITN